VDRLSTILASWHARARDGDATAKDRVITLLYPHLRAVLRRRLGGYPSDVQGDALQEAIVRVSDQLPGCRATTPQQLIGWAGVVGWRAAVRYLRSPAAGLATGLDAIDLAAVHAVVDGALVPATRLRPDRALHGHLTTALAQAADALIDGRGAAPGQDGRRELLDDTPADRVALADALTAGLTGLHVGSAAVLWLRAAEHWSYHEIASAQGTTPAAAKRRYQRAVARLRRAIATDVASLPEPVRSTVRRRLAIGDGGTYAE